MNTNKIDENDIWKVKETGFSVLSDRVKDPGSGSDNSGNYSDISIAVV